MQKFEVAVIGLGAVGSAALYQLSKDGVNVVGIDRYSPPHSRGSSHGETRITRQAIGEGAFYTPIVLRANEIWKELEQLSGEELFNRCGLLLVSEEHRKFYINTIKAAMDFSIEHYLLEMGEVEKKFLAVRVHEGEVVYFEPGAGFLRPEKCIEVQLKAAKDNGAITITNMEVDSVDEETNGVVIRLKDGQKIEADKVILASGSWINDLLPASLKSLFKVYLQILYWFDIDRTHYEMLSANKLPTFMCDTDLIKGSDMYGFYGFPAISGPNGGIKFAIHEIPLEVRPEEKDTVKPPTEGSNQLYEHISRYFRYIKPDILHSSNCIYTVTPDEDFVIDFVPGSERVIVASACSGHGFKHSSAVGEILAELATDKNSTLDISHFTLGRFTK